MDALPPRLQGCPADLDLERLLAGEAAVRERWEPHTSRCASCTGRLGWMREAGGRFTAQVFPATSEKVAERVARPRRLWAWLGAPAAVAAAAAAALLLVPTRPPEGYLGSKGHAAATPGLEVYVGEHGKGRRVFGGDIVHPGDGLRFVVQTPGQSVFLFTVDATGKVSRIYPSAGAGLVPPDGLLPGGAILDEVTGPERVFVVVAKGPITFEAIEAAAQAAVQGRGADAVRRLDKLPLDVPQDSVLLEKVPR